MRWHLRRVPTPKLGIETMRDPAYPFEYSNINRIQH